MKRLFFLILLALSSFFISCKNNEITRFYLDDKVAWAWPKGDISLDEAKYLDYYKLLQYKNNNLKKIAKSDNQYVWLKITFEIPENLKNESLGFVIPYLHFADEAYFNGSYIGGYGQFPPKEYSAQYAAHFYSLPLEQVNTDGENEIFLKVYVKGKAAISDHIFIDAYKKAKSKAELIDFFYSKIYLLFEGCILFAAIFFLIIAKGLKEDTQALRFFSMLNFFTMFLLCFFFASEIPWYQELHIPNVILLKVFLCIPIYWMLYQIPTFILFFMNFGQNKKMHIIRLSNVILCTVITLVVPDYESLVKICPWMLFISSFHIGTAISLIIRGFVIPGKKQKDIFLIAGFSPVFITGLLDIFLKNILNELDTPYFVLYGWFCTILTFLFYSSHEYSRVFNQNEHLNKFLADEVKMKTVDLTFANERLEREIATSTKDIDMAAIVQNKFYPPKEMFFDGWEISVYFNPMNKISGDIYDFYSEESKLNGIGLFDVSGHGIAASLIAMLCKNIIFRAFVRGRKSGETVSTTLQYINDRVIQEKGQVQNYLTGLLLRFSDFAEDDSCLVELSSAGHPYPIMYSAKENKTVIVTHDEYQEQYGAIGIPMTEVSFPNVDLNLVQNDILLLYTDGLTEAPNEDKEEFGKERVEQILMENHDKSTKEIVDEIHNKVMEHIGDAVRDDDITFVVIKRIPR